MIRYVTQHPCNEECCAPKYDRDYRSLIGRCAYVMGTHAVDHRRAVIRRIILRLPRNGEKRITEYADAFACIRAFMSGAVRLDQGRMRRSLTPTLYFNEKLVSYLGQENGRYTRRVFLVLLS